MLRKIHNILNKEFRIEKDDKPQNILAIGGRVGYSV